MDSKIIIMLTHKRQNGKERAGGCSKAARICRLISGDSRTGLEKDKMKELVAAMKKAGKTTFPRGGVVFGERVHGGRQKPPWRLGFDVIMGYGLPPDVFDYLSRQAIKFIAVLAARYTAATSVLEGTFDEIIADAEDLQRQGRLWHRPAGLTAIRKCAAPRGGILQAG
jgi:hypothetical protein